MADEKNAPGHLEIALDANLLLCDCILPTEVMKVRLRYIKVKIKTHKNIQNTFAVLKTAEAVEYLM